MARVPPGAAPGQHCGTASSQDGAGGRGAGGFSSSSSRSLLAAPPNAAFPHQRRQQRQRKAAGIDVRGSSMVSRPLKRVASPPSYPPTPTTTTSLAPKPTSGNHNLQISRSSPVVRVWQQLSWKTFSLAAGRRPKMTLTSHSFDGGRPFTCHKKLIIFILEGFIWKKKCKSPCVSFGWADLGGSG